MTDTNIDKLEQRVRLLEKQAIALKAYFVAGGVLLAVLGYTAARINSKANDAMKAAADADERAVAAKDVVENALKSAIHQIDPIADDAVARAAKEHLSPMRVRVASTPNNENRYRVFIVTGSDDDPIVTVAGSTSLPYIRQLQARGAKHEGKKGIDILVTFETYVAASFENKPPPLLSISVWQPGAKEEPLVIPLQVPDSYAGG